MAAVGVTEGLALVVVALPSLAILVQPWAVVLARRAWRRSIRRVPEAAPAVSVIVPLGPTEEHGASNLRSILRQQGLHAYQVICVVEDPRHPAAHAARAAAAEYAEVDTQIVASGDPRGALAKMHNLRAGLPHCRHECLAFVDSDVAFCGAHALRQLVDALGDTRIGLVTATPVHRAPRTPGGYLLATLINADLWAYLAILYLSGSMNVANGSVLVTRRSVLAQIGDLDDLQHQLLNDTALARKVRATGRRVALSAEPVSLRTPSLAVIDAWRQIMRWHVGMRRVLPAWEYVLYGYHRSALALGALAYFALHPSPIRAAFVAIPALARLLSFAVLAARWWPERQALLEIPLAIFTDLISPVFWGLSWAQSTVHWRGRSYRIRRDGRAEEIQRA